MILYSQCVLILLMIDDQFIKLYTFKPTDAEMCENVLNLLF